jgi:uncharacterized membrane protein YhaH (DUF805 family)
MKNFWHRFMSLKGELNRLDYLYEIIAYSVWRIFLVVSCYTFARFNRDINFSYMILLSFIVLMICIWPHYTLLCKRLRNMGWRSGLLVTLLIVLDIVGFIASYYNNTPPILISVIFMIIALFWPSKNSKVILQ